jgi:hypothetical protein
MIECTWYKLHESNFTSTSALEVLENIAFRPLGIISNFSAAFSLDSLGHTLFWNSRVDDEAETK